MNCLILAAGHGSRLRAMSESKPLTPVAGIPLIAHVIGAVAAAGVSEFVVVTGHQAERVEAFLQSLGTRLGVSIRPVRTLDWDRPNGHSVLAGAAAIEGDFLLAMSDHLFDEALPARLLALPRRKEITLAVDRNLRSPRLDLDDATKVETAADGRIVAIGKKLNRFDAIDTGLFLATPALAEAISDDLASGGGGSLSEGVQRLADKGRAWTSDIGDCRWIDVDDPHMLQLAEAMAAGRIRDSAA